MSHDFMDKLFKEAGHVYRESDAPKVKPSTNGSHSAVYIEPGNPRAMAYVDRAVSEECAELAGTAEGERNDVLNKAGFSLGQFVGGGYLSREEAESKLLIAGESCGLGPDEIISTGFRSGIESGIAQPRRIELPDRPLPPLSVPSGQELILDGVGADREPPKPAEVNSSPERQLRLVKANRSHIRRLKWLWKDMVPAGGLTLWAGHAGIGKSQGAAWLATQASNGSLEGELYGEPVDVLYVGTEDFWEETILARLEAAGADLDRISKIEAGIARGEEFEGTGLYLDIHMGLLREAIQESGAKLVILDALMDVIKIEDIGKQGVTRQRVSEIQRMGQELKVAFIGVTHFKKDIKNEPALHMISGSAEFGQVVRSAIGFAKSRATGEYVMAQMKRNLVKEGTGNYTYQVVDAYVQSGDPLDSEPISIGKFELLGSSSLELEDVLTAESNERNTKANDCAKWLVNYLKNSDDSVLASQIEGAAEKLGYSRTTIYRARIEANIHSFKDGYQGPWRWRLP